MAKKNRDFRDLLEDLPWWVSVAVAAVLYMFLRFVAPSIPLSSPILKDLAVIAPRFAWIAVIFLIPAAASATTALRKRRLLDRQAGIETIRSLSWKHFEELLAEAFRRQGYSVVENAGGGSDGGIDLTIRRNGNVYLVQCKQWRASKVGVKVVREMLGLVTAHGAHGAIIVTSGLFTQEAHVFASGVSVDLIEGQTLVDMVRAVQRQPAASGVTTVSPSVPTLVPKSERRCPRCNGELVVREAKRGSRVGTKFWGCSRFPSCRHTETYDG